MLGKRLSESALGAVDEALAHVASVAAYRRTPTDDEWAELAQVSLVLATFEAVYRSGLPPAVVLELKKPPAGWRAWAEAVCIEAEVEDVAVLGWAAAVDHHPLRGRDLRCNPIFKQSHALGGADADLITDDGLLIDLKSTSTRRVCSRSDLWQLCGYALADTDDELAIKNVGLSALRWRTQATWPLCELLQAFAGTSIDLRFLRREFAMLLEDVASAKLADHERRRAGRIAPNPTVRKSRSVRPGVIRRRQR